MPDFESVVAEIKRKAFLLMKENETLALQIQSQQKEITELSETIRNQQSLINTLKEQNSNLQSWNSLGLKGDSSDAKLKIDQLISTIDRSISLLFNPEQ